MNKLSCLEPVELMIWLDQESEEPLLIAEHLQQCSHCQQLVQQLQEENLNLYNCLENIATPDLTEKILIQIMTTVPDTKLFYNVLWFILLSLTSLSAALTHYLFSPFWRADSWAIAGAKLYASFTNLYFTADSIGHYLLTHVIPGKPLLPALCLTVAILLFQLFNKRRYSNA